MQPFRHCAFLNIIKRKIILTPFLWNLLRIPAFSFLFSILNSHVLATSLVHWHAVSSCSCIYLLLGIGSRLAYLSTQLQTDRAGIWDAHNYFSWSQKFIILSLGPSSVNKKVDSGQCCHMAWSVIFLQRITLSNLGASFWLLFCL